MKKLLKICSLFLSVLLSLTSLPLSCMVSAITTPCDYFTVVATNYEDHTNFGAMKTTESIDKNGWNLDTNGDGKNNGNIIKDLTFPTNTEAIVFWYKYTSSYTHINMSIEFDEHNADNNSATRFTSTLIKSGLNTSVGNTASDHPYILNTDPAVSRGAGAWGNSKTDCFQFNMGGNFKQGYFIFPISLYDADTQSLLTSGNRLDMLITPNSNINGTMYIDRIGVITNKQAFYDDFSAVSSGTYGDNDSPNWKFGPMQPTTGFEKPTITETESGFDVAFTAYTGATKYAVNVYNENHQIFATANTTSLSASFDFEVPEKYFIQVVAYNDTNDLSATAIATNVKTISGVSFTSTDKLTADGVLDTFPKTYEAWIETAGHTGTMAIWGNYANTFKTPCINLGTNGSNQLNLYFVDNNGKEHRILFNSVTVNTNQWMHIAIAVDEANKKAICYINGENKQEITLADEIIAAMSNTTLTTAHMLGGDFRPNNSAYWRGKISSLALYSDVRTADEIMADMNEYGNGELILNYDLSDWNKEDTLIDNVSHKYNIVGDWIYPVNQSAPENYDFSLAVVGDTQILADRDATDGGNRMNNLYQWIVDNKDLNKTQLVMGLGDIVDKGYKQTQWTVVKDALNILKNNNLPFTLIPGNHDIVFGNGKHANAGWYDKAYDYHITYEAYGEGVVDGYFEETFTHSYGVNENGKTYQAGEFSVNSKMRNTYKLLSVGELDYLILNLDYVPSDAALEWANSVVAAHPYHTVIVNTHCYLTNGNGNSGDGKTQLVDSDESYTTGNIWAKYGTGVHNPINAGETFEGKANEGNEIWNKFLKKHKNISLVLCGHEPDEDIVKYTQTGENGNTVTTMLINPQYFDRDTDADGCRGMVAMLYFSNEGKTIDVRWYSTVKDAYYKADNQFKLSNLKFVDARDINFDDTIDALDIALLIDRLLEKVTKTDYPAIDPNRDGYTDIRDLLRMKKYLVNKI